MSNIVDMPPKAGLRPVAPTPNEPVSSRGSESFGGSKERAFASLMCGFDVAVAMVQTREWDFSEGFSHRLECLVRHEFGLDGDDSF